MTALRTSNAPIGLSRGKPISTDNNPPAWIRPSDWLTYTVPTESEQKVIGTVAVWNQDSNYMAVNVTITDGTQYTVDWGDGTTTDYNSGTTAEKNYVWSDISSGTLTSQGYRQAIVTITPKTAGKTFSQLSLCNLHSAFTVANHPSVSPWLDISIAAPNASVLEFGQTSGGTTTGRVRPTFVENVNIVSYNNSSIAYMFRNMYSLQNVTLGNFGAGTNLSTTQAFTNCYSLKVAPYTSRSLANPTSMFANCQSLEVVPLYDLFTSGTTNIQSMFNSCSSLETVPLFNTSLITNWSSTFAFCSSLKEIPPFDFSAAQSFNGTFQNCSSLESVPPITPSAFLSDCATMFTGCKVLKTVPLFNTSAVTSTSSMFSNCNALESVPAFNFSSVTNAGSMFQNCYTLQSIPDFGFNSLTTAQAMFSGCSGLTRIEGLNLNLISAASGNDLRLGNVSANSAAPITLANLTNTKFTVTFQNCSMAAAQLDQVYTGLATLNPSITNITGTGSVVTVTVGTSFIRPFTTGRSVTISGVDPVAYNITGTVASVNNTAGTFTINNAATGTYVSGGIASITTDRTITVTGNPGVTGDDPTIATNKGWTVTG